MPYKPDIEPISKQLTIVIGLTVVGFMAFGLALSSFQHIGILSLEFHVDKLSRPLL